MPTNFRKFQKGLEKAKKRYPQLTGVIVQKLSIDALGLLIKKTPFDTGRAKGNWQLDMGKIPTGVLRTTDKGGNKTIAKLTSKVAESNVGFSVVFIVNNVPYISFLNEGSSSKASNGILEPTFKVLSRTFDALKRGEGVDG